MPHDRILLWLVALGFGALGLCGCGPKYRVTPVVGIVRLDGKPLAGVEVRFAPDMPPEALSHPFSRAVTDGSGHYELMCDNSQPGAVTGKHIVIVRRPNVRPMPGAAAPPAAGPPIPPIYQVFANSPLQIEVKVEQREYDLELKSKGK